ncbi:MAG: 50S ribosomal protein L13 [Candidatus Diapherotrites archaeon]|uniref:Large ribosomal subunit protein uL13 n=1 Tax=Candidatus Iainarchaeum sp. TaxID=3101447 RepID=A0A8T4LIS1_9ARCH|nr:50S ribosomal protein L13 [Candidatus Diapherotrites archaeon]
MVMTVIDASGLVLGRMASAVAQRLLKGELIEIVNAEKAVITGNRVQILEKYFRRYHANIKANPYKKGPKFQRHADRIVSFAVRGMLPYKRDTGKQAFKKLKVFVGNPDNAKAEALAVAKNRSAKFVLVEDISATYGVKATGSLQKADGNGV